MTDTHAATTPHAPASHAPASHAPAPEALKALQVAIDKASGWQHRMAGLIKMIAQDVANPSKSMYHLWSIQLLPTADMSQAEVHLQAAVIADAHLMRDIEEMRKPDFLSQDKAQIEKIGQEVSANMAQARQEIRSAANAVYEANMKVLNRDVGIAGGFVAADKFIIDKSPEVMGDILFAITKNEHARAAMKNGFTVVLSGVAHASADAQGVQLDEKEFPSVANVAIDAAIDEIADWVPASKGGFVKKALQDMVKEIIKNVAKTCRGKHGKELEDACIKAVNDGVMTTLDSLAKEVPMLKDNKVRQALMKPVLKAVIGAEKAAIEGKPIGEGARDGFRDGALDAVVSHGTDKLTHHASDYHEPTPEPPAHNAAGNTAPKPPAHEHLPGATHPEDEHGDHARPTHHPDHAAPEHGHNDHPHHTNANHTNANPTNPNHGHGHHEHHEHHEHHHHANSGHHGASQAVKDAWLKEHFQIDVAAHNAPAAT